MEENQKPIKVKLHTFVIIIAIAVIIMMAIFIKVQKVNSNKKIQELQTESAQLQEKITELQGKLGSISNIASTSDEKNSDSNTTFTDEEVKVALSNYLELRCAIGDEILTKLSQKGVLNYNKAETVEDEVKNITTMKVKFGDFKDAMLNFVSEYEFNNTFKDVFFIDNNDYLYFKNGIGGPDIVYTVLNINKNNDTTYTAKTSYIEIGPEVPAVDEEYSFTIKNYNGKCVIDSITKQ